MPTWEYLTTPLIIPTDLLRPYRGIGVNYFDCFLRTLANGKKPTETGVRAKIDAGGNGMPAYKDMLSDVEKDDLMAYLKTL